MRNEQRNLHDGSQGREEATARRRVGTTGEDGGVEKRHSQGGGETNLEGEGYELLEERKSWDKTEFNQVLDKWRLVFI